MPKDVMDTGLRDHSWVAACTITVPSEQVDHYIAKADSSSSRAGKTTTGTVTIQNGSADVLDVYCERCGIRPGRGTERCPRMPSVS